MKTHTLTTYSQWLSGLTLCAGLLSTTTAQACPGQDDNVPALPAVRRLEIANPQAPAKPHAANAGMEMDMRTLMALQDDTIDLVYTFAEPIPSGCVYNLQVSTSATYNYRYHTPWKSILMHDVSKGVQSEPSTGDNTIKFKLVPTPQFDRDQVHTLYASIKRLDGNLITTPTPFKFKNLAYKITNITKEPAKDATGQVVGVKLSAQLNALPKSVGLTYSSSISGGGFFGLFRQMPALTQANTSTDSTRKQLSNQQRMFYNKYGALNGNVFLLNNIPTVTWVVQGKGDVYVYLGFRPSNSYDRVSVESGINLCPYEPARFDTTCSTAQLIDMPD